MTPDSDSSTPLSVGAAASLLGVSVRTLHHWDEIGLVRPAGRSHANYRLYTEADLLRLHRVLVYRELGLSLAAVTEILADPAVSEIAHLRRQRELLAERELCAGRMIAGIDRLLEARAADARLSARERAEIFGGPWRPDWAEEAKRRWGGSPAWGEFEANTARLGSAGRAEAARAGEAVNAALIAGRRAGIAPGSAAAAELAERHRAVIGTAFACSHSMHACLATLYREDGRFRAHFEARDPGLTDWLVAVIHANARAHGVDPESAEWV
ncbi:MerR family transcriptional regulator [Mycetocola spongiae]|uniref:MerR family transcriptional regulator n=1 Tax=Mycetocola spongiae TaxID=2859226 RepID=UPI001CF58764|nr:MerR family transcriptional regulator [Mycetocola spongiae]UCR89900.1 MerR family transcriptional regulator [Mycetocola spongiae]